MGTEQKNSICDSCANCNCSFQTGMYRETCDFYIPVKELGYAVVGIEHLRKYRQLQNDYEARLKADMVAMLTELQLEIEEMENPYTTRVSGCAQGGFERGARESQNLIQQKINSLKE